MSDASAPSAITDAHVLIVGGGVSGMTCALFLARAGVASTVLDQSRSILKRGDLHNYPGVGPVRGPDWLGHLRSTTEGFGRCTFVDGRVAKVSAADGRFSVEGDRGTAEGDHLVIASGQVPTPFIEGLGLETVEPVQPYVQTNIVVDRWGRTNVPGVLACGVVAGFPSQAVICAGSGANVAVGIVTALTGEPWVDHDELGKGE
jgi:thioredoxin reductase